MSRGFRVGVLFVLALVALRVSVGWHFLYEGLWKRANPSFSAEGFFRQSRGPLADEFKEQILQDGLMRSIWEYHDGPQDPIVVDAAGDDGGQIRLNANDGYRTAWDKYWRAASAHYGFNEEQNTKAQALYASYEARLVQLFAENQAEMDKYRTDWAKLLEDKKQATAESLPFQQQRLADKEAQLRRQAAPWLEKLAALDDGFHHELEQIVGDDQRERGPPPVHSSTIELIDRWTPTFLIVVGACLIAGLFTRLSSLAGMLFIGVIVASHPIYPGVWPAPHPSEGHALIVNKDFIEMMALAALMCSPVGRWGGLDFFIHHGITRRLFGRKRDASDG